jgi:hypothetical protein
MGPEGTAGKLVVGRFTDPEGHLIGVAGRSRGPRRCTAKTPCSKLEL